MLFYFNLILNHADSANDLARELSRLREVHTKLQDNAALSAVRASDREVELHANIQSLERRLAESEVPDAFFEPSSLLIVLY
jgi:hypothetical protein